MAKFFREEEIEDFRQCFFFHAIQDSRSMGTPGLRQEELKLAMRSLGLCPTLDEIRKYAKAHGGKITFADFLEILYKHKQVEQIPDDILEGFRLHDVKHKQVLPEKEVRWMLQNFGERLSSYEVDQLFREGGASGHGNIQYNDFVRNVCKSRERQQEPPQQRETNPTRNRPQQDTKPSSNNNKYKNYNGFNGEPNPDYS